MKACCSQFAEYLSRSAERGFCMVPTPDGAGYFLRYYTANPHPPETASVAPLLLIGEMRIFYCPWCGAYLGGTQGH